MLICERCRQETDKLIGAKGGSQWCYTCSYLGAENKWLRRTSQESFCRHCDEWKEGSVACMYSGYTLCKEVAL